MTNKIFNLNTKLINSQKTKLFFGEAPVNIQSYATPKYPWIMDYAEEMRSKGNWSKNEINLSKEKEQFESLSDAGKHIYESGLRFAIALDSMAGRVPLQMFVQNDISNNPEWELFVTQHQANETLHSEAYTEMIRAIYEDPDEFLAEILVNKDIAERATSILGAVSANEVVYEKWEANKLFKELDKALPFPEVTLDVMRKALYLNAVTLNIFEGIRFFCTFATNWSFTEQPEKKMTGSTAIFELIARDEMIHLDVFQKILRQLKSDPSEGFAQIAKDCEADVYALYETALKEEIQWIKYLFKYGTPLIGMNEQILTEYMHYIFYIRLSNIGLKPEKIGLKETKNPIAWINNYLDSSNKKSAPQEMELTTYVASVDTSQDEEIDMDDL